MFKYIMKRLMLIIPTMFGIMCLNFFIIQMTPGGPVEQIIAKAKGQGVSATASITSSGDNIASNDMKSAQGLDKDFIKQIEKEFGFDKPLHIRFITMMKNYATFNFGKSYFKDKKVITLISEKLPVSISLGLWSTLIIYLISIPLGIKKAVKDGSKFDIYSSGFIFTGYAIPSFLFAIMLIILFAGGEFLQIFPLRGLVSDNWENMLWHEKILDYIWHMILPIASLVIGGFAGLTMLVKNSFLEEIHKNYVTTAKAKGLSEKAILYKHVFRNAMLIVIAGFPAAFISILFTGSLLTEVIFSLDGLGLLGYESAINRDYSVMFATLYIFTLIGLLLNLISDVMYIVIDPRINFESNKK
ncbi:MAG: microcin C ABC transporter permease YejB [Alphaproteobacteria bacterium]|nr:microcin C ABC transporter permease YejB [Alphaproteobacteria bacterium]